ncbi:MAG: LamG domain-containing protein [bacterium]
MVKRLLIMSLLIGLSFITCLNAQEFVKNGLIAMWTLDSKDIQGEVVKDVSGNGRNAKIIGTLKSVPGVIGECLQFEGKADCYVEIPKMDDMTTLSIECWAMEDQFGNIQGIISTWQWEAGKVHFKFESNQIQVHKNDGVKITFNAENGKWYHIIYTTDTKANKLQLYVDGKLASEGASGATPEKMSERRMGSEHDGRFLIGKIDEVRIYNRVLDAKEVANNFAVKTNKIAVQPRGKLATCWSSLKQI